MHDPRRALDVHVADSLAGLEVAELRTAGSIADLGAGAGLPGLVLAAVLPDTRVVLVEAAGRKCEFLRAAVEAMGLGNAEVVWARAEEWRDGTRALRRRLRARARRAAGPLRVRRAAAARRRACSSRGRARSTRARPRTRAAAAAHLGLALEPVRSVVPFAGSERRTLHVLRKVAPTPPSTPAGPESRRNARCPRRICAESAPTPRKSAQPARSAAPAASVGGRHGHRVRHRQPEGRGREDHHRGQRRGLHRRGRLRDAARRRRPAGQRDGRASAPTATRASASTTCSAATSRRTTPSRPDAGRAAVAPRLDAGPRRGDDGAPAAARLRDAPARRARARARRVRVHAARLPAVARPADGQRARRRRSGDRAGPDRVLRARGPRRSARHARADPARAEPAARRWRACC